jgi:hypothetical protein
MNQWLSIPKLFNHLWTYETMAVATVMANRMKLPKQAFSERLEEGKKLFDKDITFWMRYLHFEY